MFYELTTGLRFFMTIIAATLVVVGCCIYALFDPGPHVLLYLIASLMLLNFSVFGGLVFSWLSKSHYFFIASIIAMFIIAAGYTVLVEDIFIFLPLSLFSIIASYFIVRSSGKKNSMSKNGEV
jgi:hypothetical protein